MEKFSNFAWASPWSGWVGGWVGGWSCGPVAVDENIRITL